MLAKRPKAKICLRSRPIRRSKTSTNRKISSTVTRTTNQRRFPSTKLKPNVSRVLSSNESKISPKILADAQEEKLVIITTEINAKQKCLEMLENARKQTDLIRHRYEERLKSLSERIQHAEDEKQAAVNKLSAFVSFLDELSFSLNFLFVRRFVRARPTQRRRFEIGSTRLRREDSTFRNRK